MKTFAIFPMLILLFSMQVYAQTNAVTVKDTALMAEANRDAHVLENLSEDTELTLLKRMGGWYLVKTGEGIEGWVPMLDVRYSELAEKKSLSEDLDRFSADTDSTIATGVRGLADVDLDADEPAESGHSTVEVMESYGATEEEAKSFAEEEQLRSQNLEYSEEN